MRVTKLLLTSAIASLLPGQLVRISVASGAFTLTDILVFGVLAAFVVESIVIKKSVTFPKSVAFPAVLFVLACLASIILAVNFFSPNQIAVAFFFLIRFVVYLCLALVSYNVIRKSEVANWINYILAIGTIFALLGLLQLIIFPDLSFLQVYGWDPHQTRLVSTTLDPNYTGGILTILAAVSTSLYLFKNKAVYLLLSALFILCVFLTFSRSSYLALLVTMSVIGIIKSPRLIATLVGILLISFVIVPQARDRIIGAFTIDDTASARLESWQKAIEIFSSSPIFGVGFNTYRYAQANYDFFPLDDSLGGHSGAGSDSSFLFVAATTGLFGLTFFIFLILSLIKNFANDSKSNFLKLASLASLFGTLVHTQFVNAFFFPQTMLVFWLLVGLNLRQND